jgi:outer membrane protein assembly factor BamB
MPSRRALLTTLGSGIATTTTGCLGTVRSQLCADPPIDGPCASEPETWSTAGGDAERTGQTATAPPPVDADSSPLRLGTREEGGRRLASSTPAIGNGTAFVSVAGGVVAAMPGDEPRWAADLEDQFDAVPAVGCGVVFAAGLNETVALDPDTGEMRWRREIGSHEETAVAYRDGTLVVGTHGPRVLDARTGEEQWRAAGGRTLAVSDDGLYAAEFGNGDGDLYGYALDGDERFHLSLGKIVGSPTVADGTVYAVDNDGTVYAVDAVTGATEWSQPSLDNGKLFTGLAVRDGTLVLPAGHGGVSYGLDTATGAVLWEQHTDMVTGRPVVGPDWVAFGRTNVGVSVYDFETGAHRQTWSREEYDLGVVRGLAPVQEGLVVDGGGPTGLTLLA